MAAVIRQVRGQRRDVVGSGPEERRLPVRATRFKCREVENRLPAREGAQQQLVVAVTDSVELSIGVATQEPFGKGSRAVLRRGERHGHVKDREARSPHTLDTCLVCG